MDFCLAKPHIKIIAGAIDPKQHDFKMHPSASAPPKVLIWQNPLKSLEIWHNGVITIAKSLDVLLFQKRAPKNKMQAFFLFLWRSLFGDIWAKIELDVF